MKATGIFMTIATLLAVATPLAAQEGAANAARPAAGVLAAETVTATVQAIDLTTREVVLRTADGESIVLVVGPEARNLGQVEVGDLVTAQYQVGLVVGLGPPGVESRVDETEVVRTPEGARPGGIVRTTTAVTATITAIDAEQRIVTLQGPERTIELPVSDAVDLGNVKVGDRVGAVFEESLAILVEPVTDQN
jgi:Cu/Ag efflux protein CusF